MLGYEYRGDAVPKESVSAAMHGWSVTKQNNDPRDFGAKIHWWYNAGNWVQMRLVYIVRQPWNVDCLVPGKMQTRAVMPRAVERRCQLGRDPI